MFSEMPTTNNHANHGKYPVDPAAPINDKQNKIIVITEKDKSWQPAIANLIALCSVIVSGFLFYYTYQLFNETKKSTSAAVSSADASMRSAKAAETSIAQQKIIDSSNRVSQKQSSYQDSINNANNLNVSINALKIQENSLNQSQKDFEMESRPILVISDLILDTTYANDMVNITFMLVNVGKFPAKDVFLDAKILIGTDTTYPLLKSPWAKLSTNDYLASTYRLTLYSKMEITNPVELRILKNKKTNVYFFCEYSYKNSILKKSYSNYIVYQIKLLPQLNVAAIVNKEE